MTSPTPPQNRRTKSLASFFVTLAAIALMVSTAHAVEISAPADARSTLDDATQERIVADYGNLPLSFEENLGQTDAQVRFLSRGRGYALFLTGTEAVLALRRPAPAEDEATVSDVMRVQLVGSNPRPAVSGLERLPGQSNYLMGDDPAQWRTGIAHYGKVSYREVYPGIDLVYYGTDQRQLEHDFVVAPGADPDQIRFSVAGAESLNLDEMGNLVASTTGGDVIFQAPVTYQDIDGARRPVESQYVLQASAGDRARTRGEEIGSEDCIVGFELAWYDPAHPVVIDPVLSFSYSSYLGGSGGEEGRGIAVDGSGQAYVTGLTTSADFPVVSAFQGAPAGGGSDIFVTKVNSAGSALVYSTYIGGGGADNGEDIAVDASGNAYVACLTGSVNFPVVSAFQGALAGGGGTDACVAVLNSAGSALIYSTYLGGSAGGGSDQAAGIVLDASSNAYVTGFTTSTDFPLLGPLQGANGGGNDVFVSKFTSAGGLVYSTYIGGGSGDLGLDIAVDGAGQAFIMGIASGFAAGAPGFDTISNGGDDVFATMLNSAGSALVYFTYLGGTGNDTGGGIAVDASGQAFVTGGATGGFPTTGGAFQTTFAGGPLDIDAFVTKLNSAGTALVYSTLLGGGLAADGGQGIAVDASGSAYVFGTAGSTDFPTTASAFQTTHGGVGFNDLFLSVLNSAGSALDYSSFLGGSLRDDAHEIALDGFGSAYVAGWTQSADFPTASFDNSYNFNDDAIVAKFGGSTSSGSTSTGVDGFGTVSVSYGIIDLPFGGERLLMLIVVALVLYRMH